MKIGDSSIAPSFRSRSGMISGPRARDHLLGVVYMLLIMDGRLVRKRASVLWSLVGKSTIWERPSSWNAERKAVLVALLY